MSDILFTYFYIFYPLPGKWEFALLV